MQAIRFLKLKWKQVQTSAEAEAFHNRVAKEPEFNAIREGAEFRPFWQEVEKAVAAARKPAEN